MQVMAESTIKIEPNIRALIATGAYIRAANSNLKSNSKQLDHFAELELELEIVFFLNSNLNLHKTVRVH